MKIKGLSIALNDNLLLKNRGKKPENKTPVPTETQPAIQHKDENAKSALPPKMD